MYGLNDCPDAPWIREAEVYGMPEDPDEELEYWLSQDGPIPFAVLARLNGGCGCLTDDRDWEDRV